MKYLDKSESKKQSEYQEQRSEQTGDKTSTVTIEAWLYRIGLLLPLLFVMVWNGYHYLAEHSVLFRMPCVLHALTGYYCPGCGGTRAVEALLRFQVLRSFVYHPVVVYGAGVYVWFMLSHTIDVMAACAGKCERHVGMRWHPKWLWLAVLILLANCLIKNGALFFLNLDLLNTAFFQ